MARALDDILGKIIRIGGVDYTGVGRIEFDADSGLTIVPTLAQGSPGAPTTLTLSFEPAGLTEELADLGITISDDLYFSADWINVSRTVPAGSAARVEIWGRGTDDVYAGQRVSLVSEFDEVGHANSGNSFMLEIGPFALLRNPNGSPQQMGSDLTGGSGNKSRTYIFDLVLDMSLIDGGGAVSKSVARATVVAWRNADTHSVSDSVDVTDIAETPDALWSSASFTTTIVGDVPHLLIEFDLSTAGVSFPDIRARVSCKHSHTHRPQ